VSRNHVNQLGELINLTPVLKILWLRAASAIIWLLDYQSLNNSFL